MKKRVITLVAMAILVLGLVACNKEGSEPVSALNYQYIFMNAEVGDIVSFGHYEQDNDLSNGAEEIEWHVLSAEITPNGLYKELYIISEYVLDCQQYNEEYVSRVELTSSDLYKWLKDTFFNTAFTTEEQAYIGGEHPSHYADKIGLLTQAQLEKYFENGDAAMTDATPYALAQAKKNGESSERIAWWLADMETSYVDYGWGDGGHQLEGQKCMLNGSVYTITSSYHVNNKTVTNWLGVRPTIVIQIDNEQN
ncbi:MAG: hypothetical protein E7267_08240 [Lachnospiraceae bacterium]|nr:hypothetical protein [Lachnospiraceae bacterium]